MGRRTSTTRLRPPLRAFFQAGPSSSSRASSRWKTAVRRLRCFRARPPYSVLVVCLRSDTARVSCASESASRLPCGSSLVAAHLIRAAGGPPSSSGRPPSRWIRRRSAASARRCRGRPGQPRLPRAVSALAQPALVVGPTFAHRPILGGNWRTNRRKPASREEVEAVSDGAETASDQLLLQSG